MANFKESFVNIFFVFFPLIFYPYLLKINDKNKRLLNSTVLFLIFSAALIATMSSPLEINNLSVDFRAVPLAIGSLYGGVFVSSLLYLVLIVYRYAAGNSNEMAYIFSIVPTFFIISLLIRNYLRLRLFQKIVYAVLAYFIIRNLTLVMYLAITHTVNSFFKGNFVYTIVTVIGQCATTGLYTYAIEMLRKHHFINKEFMKNEKIKIVGDIAASVAHEIRNPLTSVRGFLQLLGAHHLPNEKRDFYTTISLEELDRAQRIITDYLNLAKPGPEHIDRINMNEEISYVCNILLSYANYQNVELHFTPPLEQLYLVGDKYKLRQAIINLGKNAIEAMPNGGLLALELTKNRNHVILKLSDTGTGMSAEQINRIGTPYYSTKERGTGLGTMVSFSIVKQMQGKIKVESELGKGTTFIITFPVVDIKAISSTSPTD